MSEPLLFVETLTFQRHAAHLLDDAELTAIKRFIAAFPTVGAEIAGCGGVHELHWASGQEMPEHFVIYYLCRSAGAVYLLTLLDQPIAEILTAAHRLQLRAIVDEIENLREAG